MAFYDKLLYAIRLLFCKEKELYSFIRGATGICPTNIALYRRALTHRSTAATTSDGQPFNNERLEFIGDAVLNAIVADLLYRTYPNKEEGFLTKARAKIVNRETLNHIAAEIGLDRMLKHKVYANHPQNNALGNALESLIGAIYLDKGFAECQRAICEKILQPHTTQDLIRNQGHNYKSKIIEWSQSHHHKIEFITECRGIDADNNTLFSSILTIDDKEISSGNGLSKKEAQQAAAKAAIETGLLTTRLQTPISHSRSEKKVPEKACFTTQN